MKIKLKDRIRHSPRIGLYVEHLQCVSCITSRVCLNKMETEIRVRKFYSETGQAALVFTHEWNQKQYQLQVKRYTPEECHVMS